VWNASIRAADLIAADNFDVRGQTVLELGAGAGLAGIVAVLQGADFVLLSDYESSLLLENLSRNVKENVPSVLQNQIAVSGHIWGQDVLSVARYDGDIFYMW
jgi:EEF1A N-terminal glycine/lysine methyltransferase